MAEQSRPTRIFERTPVMVGLGCVGLGDGGAGALGEGVAENAGLVKLWINSNDVGDAGMLALERALRKNTTLREFWFHGNPVSSTVYIKTYNVLSNDGKTKPAGV